MHAQTYTHAHTHMHTTHAMVYKPTTTPLYTTPPHPHTHPHRLNNNQHRTAVQQVISSKLLPALGAFGADWMGVAFTSLGQGTRLTGGVW